MITMLKGVLIFIFISSAVALVAIQVLTPPPKSSTHEIIQDTEEKIDTENLVFYTLTRPEDQNKPKEVEDNIESQKEEALTNTTTHEAPDDAIENLINKADAYNQKKKMKY